MTDVLHNGKEKKKIKIESLKLMPFSLKINH